MPDAAATPAPPLTPEPGAAQDAVDAAAPDQPAPPRIDMAIPAVAERRHPLRFVWQMDASGRFTLGSDEFTEVIGPRVAVALGRAWREINEELALDPENQVARAAATRDTWSGITVSWPVDGSAERLKVELSGLPIYDRNRNFLGYRGFGVCRDVDRIATLAVMRRSAHAMQPTPPAGVVAPAEAPADAETRPTLTVVPSARNVLPFRSAAAPPEAEIAGPEPGRTQRLPRARASAHRPPQGRHGARRPGGEPVLEQPRRPRRARRRRRRRPRRPSPQTPHRRRRPRASPRPSRAPPYRRRPRPEPTPHAATERPLLDRIPLGVLVYRLDTLLYANRAFLEWTGYAHIDALAEAGGLDSLFVDGNAEHAAEHGEAGKKLTIATAHGDQRPVEARLFSIAWDGEPALALMLVTSEAEARLKATETALQTTQALLLASEMSLHTAEETLQAKETALGASEAAQHAPETTLQTTHGALRATDSSLHTADVALRASEA